MRLVTLVGEPRLASTDFDVVVDYLKSSNDQWLLQRTSISSFTRW